MYCPTDRREISNAVITVYLYSSIKRGLETIKPPRLATVLVALSLGYLFSGPPLETQTILPLFHAASMLLCHPEYHYLVRFRWLPSKRFT